MISARPDGARHLYVHVPFCAHRCGYCDFVTAVGRRGQHGVYIEALLEELELRRGVLADDLETVYIGGGTPTYLETGALERLLEALPLADELTIEANPETVTPELAARLVRGGVTRVSLGAQSFQAEHLALLERRATPDDVRASVGALRDAGVSNVSLDLIYGIPGQTSSQLAHDLDRLCELAPEHVSAYELEAKPGTPFTHAHGAELERQAEELEEHMELVTETLQQRGYSWYETASFCRADGDGTRNLRSRHNLGYWLGRDYLGVGVGAVSTVGSERWQNRASLGGYLRTLRASELPPRDVEALSSELRCWELAMLGLRLEEGVDRALVEQVLDIDGLERMSAGGLVLSQAGRVRLTRRGRMLGGAVTVELLVDPGELAATYEAPLAAVGVA